MNEEHVWSPGRFIQKLEACDDDDDDGSLTRSATLMFASLALWVALRSTSISRIGCMALGGLYYNTYIARTESTYTGIGLPAH